VAGLPPIGSVEARTHASFGMKIREGVRPGIDLRRSSAAADLCDAGGASMAEPHPVTIRPLPPQRFAALLGDAYAEVEDAMGRAGKLFAGRAVWHLNSTARGGGVVELLTSLLAYARGAGVDARWIVIAGDEEFFRVTKRIHNHLHGVPGDGGELGAAERAGYERALASNAVALGTTVRRGDIVFLHDPQTAGLVAPLKAAGARVVWRCHVGVDRPNELVRRAWDFLRPYVEPAEAYVFSRPQFAWDGLDAQRVWIVPPSIDAFSAKNQELNRTTVRAILKVAGLEADGPKPAPTFVREDGTPGRVDRAAELDQDGPPPADEPLICQVSRWDRLKDPAGVLEGFAEHLDHGGSHLLLAGPEVAAVTDDPEGAEVLEEIRARRATLRAPLRSRVHLACLPMADVEENAAIVNAIQRRADIVVQKSLAEGFGLTVAEAMWKERPVVATAVGGIQDQIADGKSGILIDDPSDLAAFGAALRGLLDDPGRARRIGEAARERIRREFLGTHQLIRYLGFLERLLAEPETRRRAQSTPTDP
jgi:trehalose synthase